MTAVATIPAAYLGLSPAFAPRKVARICMDCPDKTEAENLAHDLGCEGISHGLCDSCAKSRMGDLNKLLFS